MDMDATSGPDANQSRRRGPSIFVRQVLLYLVFILLVVGLLEDCSLRLPGLFSRTRSAARWNPSLASPHVTRPWSGSI
jgi:hypothetical protein